MAKLVAREFTGSITDVSLLERILAEFEVERVFHLAALLSTRSEFTPITAHHVNVEGTLNLLEFAQHEGESHGRPVTFIYPSSIAAFGLPDLETKMRAGRVREDAFTHPTTMYGCNKLYCELLGDYYASLLQTAVGGQNPARRLPIGAFSGTHLRADRAVGRHVRLRARDDSRRCERGAVCTASSVPIRRSRSWRCPTASNALLTLAAAPRARLTRTAYNLSAFSPIRGRDPRRRRRAPFRLPASSYQVDAKRQGIVDSWPADVDDAAARSDWGFAPTYDFDRAFQEYSDSDDPGAVPAMSVTAFAPATVSNVACGFDVLGFALDAPGDRVTAAFASSAGVTIDDIVGDGGRLPRDAAKNTAGVAAQALLTRLGERRGVTLTIRKGLPLSSGLGGSAASAVAAVVAVDGLLGARTAPEVLMACAFEGERVGAGSAHGDNTSRRRVCGGFVLA